MNFENNFLLTDLQISVGNINAKSSRRVHEDFGHFNDGDPLVWVEVYLGLIAILFLFFFLFLRGSV